MNSFKTCLTGPTISQCGYEISILNSDLFPVHCRCGDTHSDLHCCSGLRIARSWFTHEESCAPTTDIGGSADPYGMVRTAGTGIRFHVDPPMEIDTSKV